MMAPASVPDDGSSHPSQQVIPVEVNPRAALEEQVSPAVSSAVLGTRVWAEDPGLGKRGCSGLPAFSFPLLLLGWGSKSRARS